MAASFDQRGSLFLRESRCEGFVIARSRNSHRTLAFVVLQYVMTQLVQKNFFQHESPKRVLRPIHKCCTGIRQPGQHCTRMFQAAGNITFQQSGQTPGRHRLLE